jgi:endonuclease/exonuclease/phosphatase family metal-dependent hydrolase
MRVRFFVVASFIACSAASFAQLRVATWNITNWSVTSLTPSDPNDLIRVNGFKNMMFTANPANGMKFAPDILFAQEVTSQTATNIFRDILNTAPGSPGDFVAAPFINGPDTESVMFYRSSKIALVPSTVSNPNPDTVALGGTTVGPRNTYRYDFYLVGYNTPGNVISCYNLHMKSGDTSTDQSRRLIEANFIRDDANSFSDGRHFIVCGDFNIQTSTQAAYQRFVGSELDNSGRVFDPINRDSNQGSGLAGNWNNNSNYRFIHTQDPAIGSAGMDDRLDLLLLSAGLLDGDGLDYIGQPNIPFNLSTWNDPNHSYRVFGNDGTTFNAPMKITGNAQLGTSLAQQLMNTLKNGSTAGYQIGHLPVFLDMKVPPVASVSQTATLDFGWVDQNVPFSLPITVQNNGDIAKWTANGINDLDYSFSTTGNFFGPSGFFSDSQLDGAKTHQISINTTTPGRKTGTVTITTNDPLRPTITINCTGLVVGRTTRP